MWGCDQLSPLRERLSLYQCLGSVFPVSPLPVPCFLKGKQSSCWAMPVSNVSVQGALLPRVSSTYVDCSHSTLGWGQLSTCSEVSKGLLSNCTRPSQLQLKYGSTFKGLHDAKYKWSMARSQDNSSNNNSSSTNNNNNNNCFLVPKNPIRTEMLDRLKRWQQKKKNELHFF